jgi:hypothetical protein
LGKGNRKRRRDRPGTPVVSPNAGPAAEGGVAIGLGFNAELQQVLMKFPHDLNTLFLSVEQAHSLGAALIQHAEAARGARPT